MFRRNVRREVELSLQRWGISNAEQLSARLGLPRRRVEDALVQLRQSGRAQREGRRPVTWRMVSA